MILAHITVNQITGQFGNRLSLLYTRHTFPGTEQNTTGLCRVPNYIATWQMNMLVNILPKLTLTVIHDRNTVYKHATVRNWYRTCEMNLHRRLFVNWCIMLAFKLPFGSISPIITGNAWMHTMQSEACEQVLDIQHNCCRTAKYKQCCFWWLQLHKQCEKIWCRQLRTAVISHPLKGHYTYN